MVGGPGDDSLQGDVGEERSEPAFLEGEGPDPSNDLIDPGLGADRVFGVGGFDILNGATGNDRIFGGAGNDSLNGGSDEGLIQGNPGDDQITGASGNDTIDAGDGGDRIAGDCEFVIARRGDAFVVVRR